MKLVLVLSGIVVLSVPLVLLADAGSVEEPEGRPAPVHRDAAALERAVLETTRAFLREEPAGVRAGLERIEASTRRLDREADAGYGSDLLIYEQAFHVTLDRAREFASRGDLENGFNQLVWMQRACVTCHGLARERGLLPPVAQSESSP